jgi:hypothetical protein
LAETKYERAIEYLQEIIVADSSLRIWFDRHLDFGAGTTNLGLSPEGAPRTVTSRSRHKLSEGLAAKRSKVEIKGEVLQYWIDMLERDGKDEKNEAEMAAILKQKMAALAAKAKKMGYR